MHEDDEFLSFTTPNKGFRYSQFSKMILVVVQRRPMGSRVVQVLAVAATTVRMLENSGAPHIPESELPPSIKQSIIDWQDAQVRDVLRRMDALFLLGKPEERTIQ